MTDNILDFDDTIADSQLITDWGKPPNKIEEVTIPGRGRAFLLAIPIGRYEEWQAKVIDAGSDPKFLGKRNKGLKCDLVARCLCNEDGSLVFRKLSDGIATISGENNTTISTLFDRAKKLNGGDADELEETEKN